MSKVKCGFIERFGTGRYLCIFTSRKARSRYIELIHSDHKDRKVIIKLNKLFIKELREIENLKSVFAREKISTTNMSVLHIRLDSDQVRNDLAYKNILQLLKHVGALEE